MSKSQTSRRSDLAPCRLPTALLASATTCCCSRAAGWLGSLITDWSCWIDSSWSTDPAPKALRPYIGYPRTVISLLLTVRLYSPLHVQRPWIQFGLIFLDPRLPPGVWYLGAILLNLLWHVARRRAVLLLRCGTSSPGPKTTAECKVRSVPFFPFAHGTLTLPSKFSLSPPPTSSSPNTLYPDSLSLTFLSPKSLSPNSLSPNSHSRHALTSR